MTSAPRRSPAPGMRSAVVHLARGAARCSRSRPGCEHSALDVAISSLFFDAERKLFVGKRSGLFELLGHQAARGLPDRGRRRRRRRRRRAPRSVPRFGPGARAPSRSPSRCVLTPSVISVLKSSTAAHCPHSVDVFGGEADYARRARRSVLGRIAGSRPGAACRARMPAPATPCSASTSPAGPPAFAAGAGSASASASPPGSCSAPCASRRARTSRARRCGRLTVAWTIAALVFAPLLWGRRAGAKRATSALA